MSTEPHRLRGLLFRFRGRIDDKTCGNYTPYKGGPECSRCHCLEWDHAIKMFADQLEALMAEPELLDLVPRKAEA